MNLATGQIDFQPTAEEKAEIEQSQPQAEAEVAELEAQAQEQAEVSTEATGVDVGGTWWSTPPDGLRWEFSQTGDYVVVQGLSPDGLIVYTGSGVVDVTGKGGVNLQASSIYDGSYFSADLELTGPNTLTGLSSNSYGYTGPVRLDRQGA